MKSVVLARRGRLVQNHTIGHENTPKMKICAKESFWATEAVSLRLAPYHPNFSANGASRPSVVPVNLARFVFQPDQILAKRFAKKGASARGDPTPKRHRTAALQDACARCGRRICWELVNGALHHFANCYSPERSARYDLTFCETRRYIFAFSLHRHALG